MAKVCLRSLKTLKKIKNCTCTLATLAGYVPKKKNIKIIINKFPSHVQLSDYLHVLATLTTRPVINITHFFSL